MHHLGVFNIVLGMVPTERSFLCPSLDDDGNDTLLLLPTGRACLESQGRSQVKAAPSSSGSGQQKNKQINTLTHVNTHTHERERERETNHKLVSVCVCV